jgi:hypothetical protein
MLAETVNGNKVRVPVFQWDEPEGCTTPRGWCRLRPDTHEDCGAYGFDYFRDVCGGLGVGNYLTYSETRGPNGETVHWVAYYHRISLNGSASDIRLGFGWVRTIEEARAMIEGNVRAHLGLRRDDSLFS